MLSNECLQHIQKWYHIAFFLIFVILAGLVMIFRYFLKITKNSVELKHADKQHDIKHIQNEQRIKSLESEITNLKEIILEKNKYDPKP